jgi:glycosyltransferase involved in cell wall biosynthesis
MNQTARLAVVAVASAPYREPFFARLAKTDGVELRVFYLHSQDSLRSWAKQGEYQGETIPCLTPEALYSLPVLGAVNPALKRRLAEFQPTCLIVCGHSFASQFIAMRWARCKGIPYLLRCDHTPLNVVTNRENRPVRWAGARGRVVRYFAERSAGALTIGSENDRFWAYFGIPSERRFFAPFAVTNELFIAAAEETRPRKARLREELGIPGGRLLIFAGRFVEKKNLRRLLQAIELSDRENLILLLVGDGPLRSELKRAAAEHAPGRVFFAPFRSQADLAKMYAIADGLVLPSVLDGWGLVVNEAMAAGLPVLVSTACGCAPDLVRPNENGFLFDPQRIDSIAGALMAFADLSQANLVRFGEKSRELIRDWNYDKATAGVCRALEAVSAL